MSTMRYSGNISIRVTYLEPWGAGTPAPVGRSTRINGEYRCFLRHPCGARATVHVGAPDALRHAVDSPLAFDDAAKASMSFAAHDDDFDWWGSASHDVDGVVISRTTGRARAVREWARSSTQKRCPV